MDSVATSLESLHEAQSKPQDLLSNLKPRYSKQYHSAATDWLKLRVEMIALFFTVQIISVTKLGFWVLMSMVVRNRSGLDTLRFGWALGGNSRCEA